MSRIHVATKAIRPGQRPRTPLVSAPAAGRTPERPTLADLDSRLRRARLLGHGPVPAVQRKDYEDGYKNKYSTETFAINRERPKTVTGKVRWVSTAGRGAAPPAIARYDPTTQTFDALLGYDGGHVLGLEAGGKDAGYNVVPMLPKFNRDTWRKVETTLASTTISYGGMNFRFIIDVTYPNTMAQVPNALTVLGYADVPEMKKVKGQWKPTSKVTKDKQVMNVTKSQPGDIELTPAPTQAETESFQKAKPTVVKVVDELKKRKDYKGDELLEYIAKNHHLPKSKAQDYPDEPGDRPYEYLDVLVLAGQVFTDANFMARKEFSGLQRTLILKYNLAKNGGVLKSDDPLDPHQNLSERGAANFPEVDHIIPKSQGGSNFFSNARLVSWQLNNKEDRVKDISPFIHISRINYPALTGKEDAETFKVKGILALKKRIHERSLGELTLDDAVSFFSQEYSFFKTKNEQLAQSVLEQMVKDGFLVQQGLKYKVA